MTERTYTPNVGDKVRLKQWGDYITCGLTPWTYLTVADIGAQPGLGKVVVQTDLDKQLGRKLTLEIPLDCIAAPIGWKPRYTITVTADKVEQVLSWFRDKRGITVHQSHYMPSCPTAFAPADNHGTGDWRFNGADSETIPAELCDELFRVVRLDTEYDAYALELRDCQYCAGTGKHTHNKALDAQDKGTETCKFCGAHLGFSYSLPNHQPGYRYGYVPGMEQDDSQCSQVKPGGECWSCSGTGKAKDYLAGMAPKLRKQAIKALEAQGWKVWYQRSGQLWRMERETVVKDFGQSVDACEVSL